MNSYSVNSARVVPRTEPSALACGQDHTVDGQKFTILCNTEFYEVDENDGSASGESDSDDDEVRTLPCPMAIRSQAMAKSG
jgi:hypothetical protein